MRRWYLSTKPHGVTFKKTLAGLIIMATSIRWYSNPDYHILQPAVARTAFRCEVVGMFAVLNRIRAHLKRKIAWPACSSTQ